MLFTVGLFWALTGNIAGCAIPISNVSVKIVKSCLSFFLIFAFSFHVVLEIGMEWNVNRFL